MRRNGRSGRGSESNYSGEDKKEAVGGGSVDKDRICGLSAAYATDYRSPSY